MSRKLVLVLVCLSIAGFSSHAAEGEPSEPTESRSAETGEVEPAGEAETPVPQRWVLNPENRSVQGLQATSAAEGIQAVDLDGRFSHALVLRIAPDGSRSVECIDSHEREVDLLKPVEKETGEEGGEQ